VFLDLEWGHAVAPGAPISVYIDGSLTNAIQRAVTDNTCGAISVSYSFCGASSSFYTGTLDPMFVQAAVQGQSVFISSGDQGAAGSVLNASATACVTATSRNVSEMAADPNVTGVGGTQFTAVYDASHNDLGSVAESAWDDSSGATGGGKSAVFAKPSYQNSVTPSDGARDVPDVSYGASAYSPGFYIANASGGSAVMDCCWGGTSIAAPMWAGLAKLVAQTNNGRLGNMNPRIYTLGELADASQSGLRDVTSGTNTFNGVSGFPAGARLRSEHRMGHGRHGDLRRGLYLLGRNADTHPDPHADAYSHTDPDPNHGSDDGHAKNDGLWPSQGRERQQDPIRCRNQSAQKQADPGYRECLHHQRRIHDRRGGDNL
jgi:hypothetical protein